jgi:hypothetical protein
MYVRDYCRKKGWQVVPVIDPQHPYSLEYKGVLYIFEWRGNRIVNIEAVYEGTSKDIAWEELPEVLKGLI